MKSRLMEHTLSILLVSFAFVGLVSVIQQKEASRLAARMASIEPYLRLDSIDFGNPLHAALFRETLNIFRPGSPAKNDSLLQALLNFRQEQFTNKAYKTGGEERGLTGTRLLKLGNMYLQFMLIYVIVMILSYHASQSLAIFR